MTSILLDTSGGNTMDLREGKQTVFKSAGGRDDQMMNQWIEDNMVQRKIINEWAHSDHTGGNIVQR